jgi:hypothetical protein
MPFLRDNHVLYDLVDLLFHALLLKRETIPKFP